MATLPTYYADNSEINYSETAQVRGNTVSDITGDNAVGIKVTNVKNLRAKNNKVVRVRSEKNLAIGFYIASIENAVLVYNTVSRTNTGFYFNSIDDLDVYNLTAHLCTRCVSCSANGYFRNVALSAYPGYALYNVSTGFYVPSGYTVNLNYALHYGLSSLVESGTLSQGTVIDEKHILYIDETNDDLTPDYLSPQVNAGTSNPLNITTPDISGIQSNVTDETTADQKYWLDLIDNSFWDIENDYAAEVSFIKAFNSRALASAEVETSLVKDDTYIKTCTSTERFSELYPMHARYANSSKFKKRVMDMWYAGQNPAVIQSYQNAIGGYNYLPSYFKRMEEYEDGWIVDVSYVNYDNWLFSYEDLKYGIAIDFLGTSTMNQATSGECYTNTMKSVADIAPVRWFLHNEVEPPTYIMFTDMYNGFENCELTNMVYNDDYNIMLKDVNSSNDSGIITTPLIPTSALLTTGGIASGVEAEISILDRAYSENITTSYYYRQGTTAATMPSWTSFTDKIGGVFDIDQPYIQFKVDVDNVLRQIDYEFMGLCLRPYTSLNLSYYLEDLEMNHIWVSPGDLTLEGINPPTASAGGIAFQADGVAHYASLTKYIPTAVKVQASNNVQLMRFVFAGAATGTARIQLQFVPFDEDSGQYASYTVTKDVTVTSLGGLGVGFATVDVDIASYIASFATHLTISISRDSSATGDTMAGNCIFYGARTLT